MKYPYACRQCGSERDIECNIKDYNPRARVECLECGEVMARVYTPPAHIYSMKGAYGSSYDNHKALRDQRKGKFVSETLGDD